MHPLYCCYDYRLVVFALYCFKNISTFIPPYAIITLRLSIFFLTFIEQPFLFPSPFVLFWATLSPFAVCSIVSNISVLFWGSCFYFSLPCLHCFSFWLFLFFLQVFHFLLSSTPCFATLPFLFNLDSVLLYFLLPNRLPQSYPLFTHLP